MARDTEKYAPYTVLIPRESEAHRLLLRDAEASGISVSKLITMRVVEWYQGPTTHLIITVNGAAAQATTVSVEQKPEDGQEDNHQAKKNAASALDAWM